jgi:[ribosomal protein S5]-alanine N-acetyltransferase
VPSDGDAVEQLPHGALLSDRLSLRRPTTSDIDEIYAIHSDPRACFHNPSDALATRDDAERLFERWNDQWERFGYGYWVVCLRRSSEPIGFCGLKTVEFRARQTLNLFYRFKPASWGNGYASEAARLVVDWATSQLPGHPLIARVRPENIASQRVAARAGLVRSEDLDEVGHDGFDWIYTANWT